MTDRMFPHDNRRIAILTLASYQQILEKVKELAEKTRNQLLGLEKQEQEERVPKAS